MGNKTSTLHTLRSSTLLLTPVLILFCATTARGDLTEEVRCREVGFSLSVEHCDMQQFSTFIDADARFVSGQNILRGPAIVAEAWQVFCSEGGPRIHWRPRIVEVLEDGQLALTRGPFRMVTTDSQGAEEELWGTFNSVWRLNNDGQWRVVFDAGSDSSTDAPAEDRELLAASHGCPATP